MYGMENRKQNKRSGLYYFKSSQIRGTWVAQLTKPPTPGSVLAAQRLLGILSLPLFAPLPLMLFLSLSK